MALHVYVYACLLQFFLMCFFQYYSHCSIGTGLDDSERDKIREQREKADNDDDTLQVFFLKCFQFPIFCSHSVGTGLDDAERDKIREQLEKAGLIEAFDSRIYKV